MMMTWSQFVFFSLLHPNTHLLRTISSLICKSINIQYQMSLIKKHIRGKGNRMEERRNVKVTETIGHKLWIKVNNDHRYSYQWMNVRINDHQNQLLQEKAEERERMVSEWTWKWGKRYKDEIFLSFSSLFDWIEKKVSDWVTSRLSHTFTFKCWFVSTIWINSNSVIIPGQSQWKEIQNLLFLLFCSQFLSSLHRRWKGSREHILELRKERESWNIYQLYPDSFSVFIAWTMGEKKGRVGEIENEVTEFTFNCCCFNSSSIILLFLKPNDILIALQLQTELKYNFLLLSSRTEWGVNSA